jgi:hypothetical protein
MRTVLCVLAGAVDAVEAASARGGAFQEFVNQSLIRLGSFRGEAAQTSEQRRGDADSDELLGVAGLGPADAARAFEFHVARLRNIGEINAAVRNMPGVPCGWLGAR